MGKKKNRSDVYAREAAKRARPTLDTTDTPRTIVPLEERLNSDVAGYREGAALRLLEAVNEDQERIDARRARAVEVLRGTGATWAFIGSRMGLNAEQARYRFGRLPRL